METMENYCTLFDQGYLMQGIALHASILRFSDDFRLWVLCMDRPVEEKLRTLNLPNVRLVPLEELLNHFPELEAVRESRSRGEFCWTSTPYLPELLFRLDPSVSRVTYVDADVFFFGPPRQVVEEFEVSGASALITEHAYSPDADNTDSAGRFNVQFMPFSRSEDGLEILHRWQSQCLECCTENSSSGSFGDQKYLDEWPEVFGSKVHILKRKELTLGPWNVRHLWSGGTPQGSYHFSGVRVHAGGETMLFPAAHPVIIPFRAMRDIYVPYVRALSEAWRTCVAHGVLPDLPKPDRKPFFLLRRLVRFGKRIQWWVRVDVGPWQSILGWSPFRG